MEFWYLASALLVFIFLMDDLFIDWISLILKLKPTSMINEITENDRNRKLAVMVANWKEEEVLSQMIHANTGILLDENTHIFLGVYPNDEATLNVAKELSEKLPQVHCVVNNQNGPTYKGQMLDEIISGILQFEIQNDFRFDAFILHDSEDLIDPSSLLIYRQNLAYYEFIQTPVLSFNREIFNFVGGTYLDEFAETHSKDLLVRQATKVAIPSAGVGTCMKRNLVLYFRQLQGGALFPHKDLTEDYILGMRANQFGFRSLFACHIQSFTEQLVATREFFPSSFKASIRQKARWTLGICFQGWQRLGWFGNFNQRYFLWRDRKAILAPFVTINCFALLFVELVYNPKIDDIFINGILLSNLIFMVFRIAIRIYWVNFHHGKKQALMVPFRWPFCLYINTCAGLLAIKEFVWIQFLGKEVLWKKTQHTFPMIPEDLIYNQSKVKNNKEILL